MKNCSHSICGEPATAQCDNCDNYFCNDHGSRGGDRETEQGLRAVPSACWECGGFNVDQE